MADQPEGIERVTGPDGNDVYLLEYEIVDGPIEETRDGLTLEVEEQYSELHELTMHEPEEALPRLEALVAKYPAIPVLKNWLSVAYTQIGRRADAEALEERLWREHPDYLFARVARAHYHLGRDELDEVPKVLGKLDLKLMYPHRNVFHVSEAVALWSVLADWCFRRGDDEPALRYLDEMMEVAPDHPLTRRTELLLMPLVLKEAMRRLGTRRRRAKPARRKKTTAKGRKRPPPPQESGPRNAC